MILTKGHSDLYCIHNFDTQIGQKQQINIVTERKPILPFPFVTLPIEREKQMMSKDILVNIKVTMSYECNKIHRM